MNDRVDRVIVEDVVDDRGVGEVALHEGGVVAAQSVHRLHCLDTRVRQVVGDDDAVAAFEQSNSGVAADVTGATSDQNRAGHPHLIGPRRGEPEPWLRVVGRGAASVNRR